MGLVALLRYPQGHCMAEHSEGQQGRGEQHAGDWEPHASFEEGARVCLAMGSLGVLSALRGLAIHVHPKHRQAVTVL